MSKIKLKINNFLFQWHDFPIDYWWRKKYKVPFGSKAHREMNFIDMLIEYQEDLMVIKSTEDTYEDEIENEELGLNDNSAKRTVPLTNKEIDEDYNSLDLEQFDE